MLKKVAYALISVGIGLLIATLIAEFSLRLLGISSEIAYVPNSEFGWGHSPNSSYFKTTEGRKVKVDINSAALRDREFSIDKAPGRTRILVLGDSFMEALQVPLESTFAKKLETRLAESSLPAYADAEVLNAGVSAFGTDNELLYFRNKGGKFDPDIVLLAFYVGNDVRNNWYKLEIRDAGGHRKPYFELTDGQLTLLPNPDDTSGKLMTRAKTFMNRNSRLYTFARRIRDGIRAQSRVAIEGMPLDWQIFREDSGPEWQMAWAVTGELLRQLKIEVESAGAEFLVVVIPTIFQVDPSKWQPPAESGPWDLSVPNKKLARIFQESNIAAIDLLPLFRREFAKTGDDYYLPLDEHWNEAGHSLAAAAVFEFLTINHAVR